MCSATKVFRGQKGLGGSGTTGPGVGEHQTGGLGAHRARADGKGWQLRAHLAEEAHLWEQSMVPQGSWLQWWVVLAGSWLCHQAAPLTLQLCLAEADKLTSPARWGSSGGCSEGLGSSHRLSRTSTGSTAASNQVLGSQQGSYRSEAGSVPQLGKTPNFNQQVPEHIWVGSSGSLRHTSPQSTPMHFSARNKDVPKDKQEKH